MNIDFNIYQIDFCVKKQTTSVFFMSFVFSIINIDVNMNINFEIFDIEFFITTIMNMSFDVTTIEIKSKIVICNIKICIFVNVFSSFSTFDFIVVTMNIVCEFFEVIISISNIKNLNHITSFSSHYFFDHEFVTFISMFYFFIYLLNNKLSLINRKSFIKNHYKKRSKIKIKALKMLHHE